jgi:hypothetical protein
MEEEEVVVAAVEEKKLPCLKPASDPELAKCLPLRTFEDPFLARLSLPQLDSPPLMGSL